MNGRYYALIICCILALVTSGADGAQAQEKRKGRSYFEQRGEVVWEVATDQKVIALTFDDGPNPTYTPQVLDLLKEYQAKATFFVIGTRVEQYPELAQREVQEGHELANHSYHHPGMSRISPDELRNEIVLAQEAIRSKTGKAPMIFRPPGGVYNETIVNTAREAGYKVIMWSWDQDTRDWQRPGVSKIVQRVLGHEHNGGIVLFHDHGGDRSQTVAALGLILPELQKRGYRFVTVSELLELQKEQSRSSVGEEKHLLE